MHIEMKGIDKQFGGNYVLKDAGFSLDDAEIHALMGENGAGKSTLMKILTGVYTRDAGTVIVDGREVVYHDPQEAERAGIVFIYQELNVLRDLTVEENMFLGKEIRGPFGICDSGAMRARVREILNMLGVNIDPGQTMDELSVGQQQMIEIAKALMSDAKVIIMDEPTSALTQAETQVLFDVVRRLKDRGVSIIYISHRLEEIFRLSDRIEVIRDGEYVKTLITPQATVDELIQLMVGREMTQKYPPRKPCIKDEVVLDLKHVYGNGDKDISLQLHAGEVLGLGGLVGAGRTELAEVLFGAKPKESGEIIFYGKEINPQSPREAIDLGIALVPEDRKRHGALLTNSIKNNINMPIYERISNASVIDSRTGPPSPDMPG